jgi:enoyl-CoA hydratase/carnithine racemase
MCDAWCAPSRATAPERSRAIRPPLSPETYEEIRYEVEDGVLTLTLHRPDKLNAFTVRMLKEMVDAFDRADADDAIRAVIVTGSGRAFCAGADLSAGAATFDYAARDAEVARQRVEEHRDGGGILTLRIFQSRKPVIAAINGPAVGVGVTMTLPMDIRIAAEGARFGFVFTRRGIVPEACSSWFLPRIVGIDRALEWTFTGRLFDAGEARDAGLVRSLHAPNELLSAAKAIAGEIAAHTSPVSVAVTRQLLWRMLGESHPMAAHRIDSRAVLELGRGPDAREGVAAFLEKRAPRFTGSTTRDLPAVFPWWTEPEF